MLFWCWQKDTTTRQYRPYRVVLLFSNIKRWVFLRIRSKLARVADVKSRWSTTFSRIENLWPRDGSCPLPLRSKRIFNKCFRIVKTQKISRGGSAHVWESPFAPNEVPAPVCAAALTKSRYHVRSAHEIFNVQLP